MVFPKKKTVVRKGRMTANPMTYGHLVEERTPVPKKKKDKMVTRLVKGNVIQ
jgi:hypothetical protein